MDFKDLLPFLTGGGGCIVAMAFGYYLLLKGRFVLKSQYDLAISQVSSVQDQNDKLRQANDILQRSVEEERAQKAALINDRQSSNQLIAAVIQLAGGRPPPVPGIAIATPPPPTPTGQ